MGLDFFRRAVAQAERLKKPWQRVQYTLQTNGTCIDEAWADFFKAHDFLIGLSLDGPESMHNTFRTNRVGKGSYESVMRGWEWLKRYQVDVNILCALSSANAEAPLDVYHFFRDDLGAQYLQFIPVVERTELGKAVTSRSIKPEQFGQFLVAIFDEWVRQDVGEVFVQAFDVALGAWMGVYSLCTTAPTCGNAFVLEHNGDLYACDHFVDPEHRLGNIQHTHLLELISSEKPRAFGQAKYNLLPQTCQACPVEFACYGGCPKDRFLRTQDGEPGLNYLCKGYQLFFQYVNRSMQIMAGLLRNGQMPREIMAQYS